LASSAWTALWAGATRASSPARKQISNRNTTVTTSATATPPIMSTGKTSASGLESAPANFRPWPITATKIATDIRKMIPPMIVVPMGFSMIQALLIATSGRIGDRLLPWSSR
jgi:hypothetical protein